MLSGRINILFVPFRNVCCCHANFNKYAAREARFMNKIMGNKGSEKRPWYNTDSNPLPPFPKTPKSIQHQRRVVVLNKVFMMHISEMMASGSIASEIVGRGVEISRVKMAPDFNRVNVFWLAKGTEDDSVIEQILQKCSKELRHELSQLRVIGIVPPIHFVKDRQYAKVVEVNRILATADFGDDYVPVDVGYQLKSEFTNEMASHQMETLPPMRQDVLGVNHADILARIKKGMRKAKAPHRQDAALVSSDVEESRVEDTSNNVSLRKADFAKFLRKHKIQRKKHLRGSKNYTPEMELHESEVLENSRLAFEFMEQAERDSDGDYLEEKS